MHELAARTLFEDEVGRLSLDLIAKRSWIVHETSYPLLDIEFATSSGLSGLRLKWDFSNWNSRPPSILLCNPEGLPLQQIQGGGIFNGSAHPKTGRPFICMAGILEYHEHPSHLSENWENYKILDAFSLGGLLTQVWNGWLAQPKVAA